MAEKRRHPKGHPPEGRAETLRRRAQRQARRGRHRKAALHLRELAGLTGEAGAWVALGDMLRRAGRPGEALPALRHGMWLHRRAGGTRRARTVALMILQVDPDDAKVARLVGLDRVA